MGLRGHDWLGRLALEMRIGRTARPYVAPVNGATAIARTVSTPCWRSVEVGRIVRLAERVQWTCSAALGADVVKPYKAEDLTLGAFNASLGAGLRVLLGPDAAGWRVWTAAASGWPTATPGHAHGRAGLEPAGGVRA